MPTFQRTWSEKDGLFSTIPNQIYSGPEGFLWYGTSEGVQRFDGSTFHDLTTNDGLPSNTITAITADSQGRMWFKTSRGLAFLESGKIFAIPLGQYGVPDVNIDTGSFATITFSESYVYFLSNSGLMRLSLDDVDRYANQEGAFKYFSEPVLWSESITPGATSFYGMAQHINGDQLVGTNKGLWLIREQESTLTGEQHPLLGDRIISAVEVTANGSIWMRIPQTGNIWELSNNKIVIHDKDRGFPEDPIYGLFADGVHDDGLIAPMPTKTMWYKNGQWEDAAATLGIPRVGSVPVHFDKNNNVWFYSDRLVSLQKSSVAMVSNEYFGDNVKLDSVAETKEGEVFISTSSGIFKLNPDSDLDVQPLQLPVEVSSSDIAIDNSGNLWIETNQTVYRLIGDELQVMFSADDSSLSNTLLAIFEMTFASDNTCWIAKTGSLVSVNNEGEVSEIDLDTLFDVPNVRAVVPVSENEVWIGTQSGEIAHLNLGDWQIYGKDHGLPQESVRDLALTRSGEIWAAVGSEVYLMRPNQSIINISALLDLPYSPTQSIIEDNTGQIWLYSYKGLHQIRGLQVLRTFTYADGLTSLNPTGSGFFGADNRIWLAAEDGIAIVNPRDIHPQETPPRVSIESIKINEDIQNTEQWENRLLEYTQNNINVEFSLPDFRDADEVEFRFRLDGYDKGWRRVEGRGNRYESTYTNLPNGRDYHFRIKGRSSQGVWSEEQKFSFVIERSWFTTWWFISLAIILSLALAYSLYRGRVAVYRARQRHLESLIDRRTEELREKNQQLERRNTVIEENLLYAQKIQRSILPLDDSLARLSHDAFVIWKPKDRVGGDFYWIDQSTATSSLAIVDCTGHGIPGAFMSMLGYGLINSLTTGTMHTPSETLLKLNELLLAQFHIDKGKKIPREGMDVGLIVFHTLQRKLSFAAANMSLYIEQDNQVRRVKGSSISIGSVSNSKKALHFDDHQIEWDSPIRVYLVSDGLLDQPLVGSGDKLKRLGSKKWVKWLSEHASLTLEDQKTELTRLLDRGIEQESQYDDITVIALELA